MGIEICPVGGYMEVGKNMTAIKVDDEVFILDMGIHLPNYISYTEDEDIKKGSAKALIKARAIPDHGVIEKWRSKVKAIIPTHAHLDHVGAIPYLAKSYKAPIIATPFTAEVIKRIFEDERLELKNDLIQLAPNDSYKISENVTIEFINITHSTPHSVIVALHTKYGVALYANDFKLDNTPTLGEKPNYKAMERIGNLGVKVAIIDSLYAYDHRKTPSEAVAKELLKDVLLGVNAKGRALVVTTFSSHLPRLKAILECGKKLKRKVVFLGRSLSKYIGAGEAAGIINFSQSAEIVKYRRDVKAKLKQIQEDGPHKYLMVVTGHQGEPQAILARLANKALPFQFQQRDHIIFSCNVIPTEINKRYRQLLERNLKKYGVRIFKGIHVSGHASREDARTFLEIIKPEHIVPAHAEYDEAKAMVDIGEETGHPKDKVHLLDNGQILSLE